MDGWMDGWIPPKVDGGKRKEKFQKRNLCTKNKSNIQNTQAQGKINKLLEARRNLFKL